MQEFLRDGKGIAVCGHCNSNGRFSVINEFLSDFGMRFENDGVVRTAYSEYLHPKNALITDGIVHRSLLPDDFSEKNERKEAGEGDGIDDTENMVHFVYPYGCTMDVHSPSWPILSSGSYSFPLKRPLCCVWEDNAKSKNKATGQRGRLLAIGSSDMFGDKWFDKESNVHLLDRFTQFLLHENGISYSRNMSRKDEIEESRPVPDIEALAERLKWCLQENTPLPQDLSTLYRQDILSFDSSLIPKVVDLYEALDVKHEPLTLILPEFERPIPPLKPAVFQPKLMDLPPPALEKFALDDELVEPKIRLAHLTNKCSSLTVDEDDLEYYVQEAGIISNLVGDDDDLDAKVILHELFQKLVAMKGSSTMEVDVDGHTPMNNIEIKPM